MTAREIPKRFRPARPPGSRRWSTGWRVLDLLIAGAVLAGLGALATTGSSPEAFAGPARAVDGDTLDMLGVRVRLQGIDAPELYQSCTRQDQPWACGEAARAALAGLVAGRRVACTARTRDRYARPVARCTVDDTDLGARLVETGMAVAFGQSPYRDAQARARADRRGIWVGAFQMPADYRAAHPRVP